MGSASSKARSDRPAAASTAQLYQRLFGRNFHRLNTYPGTITSRTASRPSSITTNRSNSWKSRARRSRSKLTCLRTAARSSKTHTWSTLGPKVSTSCSINSNCNCSCKGRPPPQDKARAIHLGTVARRAITKTSSSRKHSQS